MYPVPTTLDMDKIEFESAKNNAAKQKIWILSPQHQLYAMKLNQN